MSKDLKKAVGIIGIIAFGAATFGIGALAATGVASSVGAAAGFTTSFGVSLGTIATVGAGLMSVGAAPDVPSLEDTGAAVRGTAQFDPNALFVYAFGRTIVPSQVVYEEIVGDAPDRKVHVISAHCYHRIEQYVSFNIGTNDGVETVTFTGDDADAPFNGLIFWKRADGTQAQSLVESPGGVFSSSWPGDAVGENVAHSYLVFFPDEDAWQDHFSAVPRKREIEVDGAWLYDPRLDPDHGSGTQDFDDPSTWSFNNGNAALVALRYARGEYNSDGDLLWGRGAPESDIDMDTFVSMANVADETVDSKPRFRLGGIFQLSGDWDEFARRWEEETGGKIYRSGGRIACWLPHDDLTALTTITEDDLVTEEAVAHEAANDIQRWFNTARGRYIEPDDGYRGKPYPEVEESTAVTTDGSRRILYRDFSWIQDRSIAERIARILVRRSRFQRVWVVGMGWKGQGPNYAPFTIHNLNLLETNETNVLVRVIDRSESLMSGLTVLTLQEEDASIYDDTLPLGTAFDSNTSPARSDPISLGTIRTIADGAVGRQAAEVIFEQATLPSSPQPRQLVYLTSADGGFNADTWVVRNSANTAWIKVGAHDALELINGPNESGADQTVLHANSIDNPEFEAGDTGWTKINGGTIVNDPANARLGSWAGKYDAGAGTFTFLRSTKLQVGEGDRVLAQAHFKKTAGAGNGRVRIFWLDESEAFLANGNEGNSITSSSYSLSRAVSVAPSGAAAVKVYMQVLFADASTELFVDGAFMSVIPQDADIDALQTTNGDFISDTVDHPGQLTGGVSAADGTIYRTVARGVISGTAVDGENIIFDPAWDAPPTVQFLDGGISSSSSLSGDQTQDFDAINLSGSGFTARLKIKELTGSTTTQTDTSGSSPSSPSGLDHSINKSVSAEAVDETYEYQIDVEITNVFDDTRDVWLTGSVTVGYYTNDGSGWVQRDTETFSGAPGSSTSTRNNQTKNIIVSGLGLDDDFGVTIENTTYGAEVTSFDQVEYEIGTAPSEASATPSGAQPVQFLAIGG